jgi:hypothetical protein
MTPSVSLSPTAPAGQVAPLAAAPVILQQPPSVVWVNGDAPSYPQPIPMTVTSNDSLHVTWARGPSPYMLYSWDGGQYLAGTYTFNVPYPPSAFQNGEGFQGIFSNSAGTVSSNISTLQFYYAPQMARIWGSDGSYSNAADPTVAVGDTVTVYAWYPNYAYPFPTVQWLINTGNGFRDFTDGQSGFDTQKGAAFHTFTATAAEDGAGLRAVFTNMGGTSITNTLTLTVNQVSSVSAAWGTAGTAALQVASDGLHLLPAGRTTDIPWMGINSLAINLNHAVTLLPSDVSVKGVNVADYGPVSLSGSGTSYVITLAQPINAADRVTVTINNAALSFTGELDVLPGDVNDDGVVNAQDLVLIRNEIIGSGNSTIGTFGDLNGDGAVDMTDFNLARQRIGTRLP